ncbi:hypothetical protein ABIB99_003418, partial [Bradyrhizobium sp. LA6.1]|uniref:hypothetical protein n=1 Tax=Bradyrhizobium sp. LA6.1 TaxID=3156378 RepID=UPI003393F7CC
AKDKKSSSFDVRIQNAASGNRGGVFVCVVVFGNSGTEPHLSSQNTLTPKRSGAVLAMERVDPAARAEDMASRGASSIRRPTADLRRSQR